MHLYGGGAGVRSWLLDCWVFMPGGWVLPAYIAMVVTKVDLPWVAERPIRLAGVGWEEISHLHGELDVL